MSNLHYFLALNRISGVGPCTVKKCLTIWPNLADMFRLSQKELELAGLSPHLAMAIKKFNFTAIESDMRWQTQENHHLITWEDEAYPKLLQEIYDPPIVLYAQGHLDAFAQQTIAVIGTRNPTITGSETAKRFAYELAEKQITIVSGLALGIDAQAHEGCLKAGGKTIAVMATGIDYIYPRRHVKLAEKIIETGLILSEFPLGTSPIPGHFPRRNRIISGLSLSTLVVEASLRSGSLITARLALEQNRDVLAIPSSIHNLQAKGCHYLLQQGAKLVTSSVDVLLEMGYVMDEVEVSTAQKKHKNQSHLMNYIGFEMTTMDEVIQRSGLTVTEVSCELAELELNGLVRAVPGGYMRCVHER